MKKANTAEENGDLILRYRNVESKESRSKRIKAATKAAERWGQLIRDKLDELMPKP